MTLLELLGLLKKNLPLMIASQTCFYIGKRSVLDSMHTSQLYLLIHF